MAESRSRSEDPGELLRDPAEELAVCGLEGVDLVRVDVELRDRFAGKPMALIGEGLVYYKDKFNDPAARVLDEKFWNPSAANVHRLGWHKAQLGDFADVIALTPNYLRGPDAKVKEI